MIAVVFFFEVVVLFLQLICFGFYGRFPINNENCIGYLKGHIPIFLVLFFLCLLADIISFIVYLFNKSFVFKKYSFFIIIIFYLAIIDFIFIFITYKPITSECGKAIYASLLFNNLIDIFILFLYSKFFKKYLSH